jgi:two-component system OmpR family sensor kinase/two-component system sensor histidine kinase BaeS
MSKEEQARQGMRYLPIVVFFVVAILLFVGGTAAALYLVFSEYSGVRNLWLLVCGGPMAAIIVGILLISSLYTRYGKPLQQIIHAIDAIAEGDYEVRVPEDNSPQFGELIQRFNKMVGELGRTDQQRRNLTADIAHELRTPLHILQGRLEGMLDGVYATTPDQIEETLEETRLLGHLVEDLQTLSMAESGQLTLRPTRFLLADLVGDLASSFAAQAEAQGVELVTRNEQAPQHIMADYMRMHQVLSNLVSNALRYTSEGGEVSIETDFREVAACIRVKDNGSGIPAENLPFVFDRFWRGEKARSRDGASSGLGLAIAQQLVKSHGGQIEVESNVGQGSTFTIELPLENEESAPDSDAL